MANSTPQVYVAGHRGLVGSALMRTLEARGYSNILTRTSSELDLREMASVQAFLQEHTPDHLYLAAAKVGGIHANSTYPAEFIYDNLAISSNVIHAAYEAGVKKLLFLGSSCIYPKLAPQPMKEEHLLTSPLEPSNEPYAIAKIAGLKMCASYNRQYGTNFLGVMPTNLYGPGDNYHPENSHVLPALIQKFHLAKEAQDPSVTVWGSGKPRREFLFSEDLAQACVHLMENCDVAQVGEFVNVGVGKDIAIAELAALIGRIVGFEGTLEFDASKPDGTPQKLLDCSKLGTLGWNATTKLEDGIAKSYQDFLNSHSPS